MDQLRSVEFAHKSETLWSNEHFILHNEQLQVFFENQQFCDITLISGDEKFKVKAHKIFLASISKYFLGMFGGQLLESNSDEVKLTLIDGHSLKLILNFIYKGIIELTADTVESILTASHILELNVLEKLCCGYIKKDIDVSNCLGIADMAKRRKYDDLYEAAMICACAKFTALSNEDEFKIQSFEQLCALLTRDDLRASSEAEIYLSILQWINHAKDERKQFLEKLLNYVRFPLLSPSFIGKIVEEVGETVETLRIICKAFTWHSAPSWRSTIFPREQCRIRSIKDVIVAISGCDSSHTDLNVGLYYSGLNEWIYTKWPAIPYPRVPKYLIYTMFNKKLVVAGGIRRNNQYSNRVDCLNLDSLEWTTMPDLAIPDECTKNAIFVLNDLLYAIGGNRINKLMKPFEKWESMEVPRRSTSNLNQGYNFVSDDLRNLSEIVSGNVYATFNNKMYIPQDRFYCTYNIVDNSFQSSELIRQQNNFRFSPRGNRQDQTSTPAIGVHIIKNLDLNYLVEITRDTAFVYDLESKCRVFQHEIAFDEACNKTALHGNDVIIYGGNIFYKYNPFVNQMDSLPPLINSLGRVDILLTNNYGA